MAGYYLPLGWGRKIDAMMRRLFLWEDAHHTDIYCLVSWKNVCRPKEFGGLWVLDLGTMNKALLAKWLWKLFWKSSLHWCHPVILKCYYDSNVDMSKFWKGVLRCKDSFLMGMEILWDFDLAGGQTVSLWLSLVQNCSWLVRIKRMLFLLKGWNICLEALVPTSYPLRILLKTLQS